MLLAESAETQDVLSAGTPRQLVLIVEDEEGVRSVWERAVTALGYEAIAVADAEAAMEMLSPPPNVAILDVHLPGASGLWLSEEIRRISPTTAIVFATGDSRIPPKDTLAPHVTAYLVKPFSAGKFQKTVRTAMEWSETESLRRSRFA